MQSTADEHSIRGYRHLGAVVAALAAGRRFAPVEVLHDRLSGGFEELIHELDRIVGARPGDPELDALTENQVREMLADLYEVGRPLGVVFPSADIDGVAITGAVVVAFGGGPVATVTNLMRILREYGAAAV